MEILKQGDIDARISSVRPLSKAAADADDNDETLWNIRFPEGGHPDTRISIMNAKLIVANLTIRVLEAEKRQLLREFKREQKRGEDITKQYSEMSDRWMRAAGEVAQLKRRLRKKR
jgi:hypothetical protein